MTVADRGETAKRTLGERFRVWGPSAWGAIGVILLAAAVVWLAWTLRAIVLPVLAGIILAVALAPVARWMMAARLPRGVASLTTLVVALAALAAFGSFIAPTIAEQFSDVGGAVREAVDRLERWVDRERPFGFTGDDVDDARTRIAGVGVSDAAEVVGVSPVAGLRYVGTALAAVLITLVSTFFFLRDGPVIRAAIVARARPGSRRAVAAACDGAVGGVRSFLAGAALLGVIEGTAVGVTLWLTGSELALVMATLTFLGAFVPFIGAIITGLLAVAVALVTAGTGPAIVVAIVILVVQQFDNDLLAPLIYGKLLQLHPLVVILSTAAGIEAAGVIGAFATVPLVAAATGAHRRWSDTRAGAAEPGFEPAAAGEGPVAST